MQNRLRQTAELLIRQSDNLKSLGLFSGKMGTCIFFYLASRELNEHDYEAIADNIIDEIYDSISDQLHPLDFENGLAGIAWGLHYLKDQGFIEGDLDDVLDELDDKIFQYAYFSDAFTQDGLRMAIGLGLYALKRIEDKDNQLSPDKIFCFQRLLVNLVNNVSLLIEKDKRILSEPPMFNLYYHLPLCLFFLSEVYKQNIYNNKIERIYDSLSPSILTTIPLSLGNRLYLAMSLNIVVKHTYRKKWADHALLLMNTIDMNTMLNQETVDKHISLLQGKAGLLFILHHYNQMFPNTLSAHNKQSLLENIINSTYWDIDPDELSPAVLDVGNGIAGVGLAMITTN